MQDGAPKSLTPPSLLYGQSQQQAPLRDFLRLETSVALTGLLSPCHHKSNADSDKLKSELLRDNDPALDCEPDLITLCAKSDRLTLLFIVEIADLVRDRDCLRFW